MLFPYVPNQACLIPVAKQNAIFSVCLKKHRRLDISCIVMPGMRGARNIKIVQIILHFSFWLSWAEARKAYGLIKD
ncbi:hypothetical protein, partial [Enterobacter hormaechei]|uniref:hypothetical protein n=1 Tax=Enterobacter hormaechei TaxID=158836 RepID=UPI001C53829F